jgi:hypothetical protein
VTDVLAPLAALAGVADAVDLARRDVDALLWERSLRTAGGALAAESVLRGARASAAIDGADVRLDALRSGAALDSSPIGQAVAASLRVSTEVPALVSTFAAAPAQALARLAALAGAGAVSDDELGRPRQDDRADDPLRLGPLLPPAEVAARLEALMGVLTADTGAPALVVAAVAHGELLALRPFGYGSGLVARAAARLVLAARGLDPHGLAMPEPGLLAVGRPAYATAARGFLTGTPLGVASFLVLQAQAVGLGARESRAALADLSAG